MLRQADICLHFEGWILAKGSQKSKWKLSSELSKREKKKQRKKSLLSEVEASDKRVEEEAKEKKKVSNDEKKELKAKERGAISKEYKMPHRIIILKCIASLFFYCPLVQTAHIQLNPHENCTYWNHLIYY